MCLCADYNDHIKVDLTTVYLAKLTFEVWKLLGLGWLATVRTPRKIREARQRQEAAWREDDYRRQGRL